MATLEIHDERGRVQRVRISRNQPALFGSGPECDIVLNGQGVLPVHGRLRWKHGRYKVDASPQAKSIERNGKKVASASFRIGDEVRVAGFRIFMINPDTGPLDDKTRLLSPPQAQQQQPIAGRAFEGSGWLRDLEVAPPSVETATAQADSPGVDTMYEMEMRKRQARAEKAREAQKALTPWARLRSMIASRDQLPGQERILSSPLVIGLVASLGVLIACGIWLRGTIERTAARRQLNLAIESLDGGEYLNAIKRFEEFIEAHPKNPQVGKARVLKALANVKQYASSGTPSWTNALRAERAMVKDTSRLPAYRDESTELAELVLKTAEGLAERATAEGDAKVLADANGAVALHKEIMGEAADALRARTRVPRKLEAARASVARIKARADALAAMDKALRDRNAAQVYEPRDKLVARYPDFAADRDVIDRLTKANDLIREAVKFDPSRRPGETEPNPERLGPPTSLVLRAEPGKKPAGSSGPLVFALAEGFAYGLDGETGAPLWHVPVGLSSPFPPQPLAGAEGSVLVCDARHDELLRLDARTGALKWRQGLEEPISAPPLVLGNQAIVTTPSGKLLFVNLKSGELEGTLVVGRRLGPTPVADEAGQYLYLMADESIMLVIKRDPPSCTAVEYTGHSTGSVLCPPLRVGKYLVVAENRQLDSGVWTAYELRDESAQVRQAQSVEVPGWTWSAPATKGSVIWSVGDRGGPRAFSISEDKQPLKPIAKIPPDTRASGPAFAIARTEREVWIASSRSGRFELNAERGLISPAWTLLEAGSAVAPIQVAGKLIVLTSQNERERGVSLWGLEASDGKPVWRTLLGAPWPVSPVAATEGQGDGLMTVTTDGRLLSIDRERLQKGGFVEEQLPRAGLFTLPPGPLRSLEVAGATLVVPSADASSVFVREHGASSKGDNGSGPELHALSLPAPLAAEPLVWGNDLLVPGSGGRVYLIDPKTGASKAEPYVPPFDRDKPTRWRTPARLSDTAVLLADEGGRVRRITRNDSPRPKLVAGTEVSLGAGLASDPVTTGEAILFVTDDDRVRSLAARDFSPQGAWPLEAPRALGPVDVKGYAFVADVAGRVIGFAPGGERLWSVDMEGPALAATPVIVGENVALLQRDGAVQVRTLANGGLVEKFALQAMPSGQPEALKGDLVLPVAPGSLRLLAASALEGSSGNSSSGSSSSGASEPAAGSEPKAEK